ncbi:MAG: D-glycero-beta-D-manno-heptose 1-phosphate adenylyltransferase [Bacteroidales bacterium]
MKNHEDIENKIISREMIASVLRNKLAEGKKIVFTNGCFDILHPGHIHLLTTAKQYGDILVVGLNSDTSVKMLKGESRPVLDEDARAVILASLEVVDYVVVFSEETPLELIREINPDILVKGGDYRIEEIVGSKYMATIGGRTYSVPLLEGFSSSKLIDKSRNR